MNDHNEEMTRRCAYDGDAGCYPSSCCSPEHEASAQMTAIGNMTIQWAEGISQADRAKLTKAIEAAPAKYQREEAKRFTMPKLTRLTKPTVEMLNLTGTGELVMPEDARRSAVLELARKRYKAWLANPKGDPEAAKYDRDLTPVLAKSTTETLVKLVESNISPGARLEGKFAATLVNCWDELARRSGQVAA